MRKFSLFAALFLLAVGVASCIAWTNRENILAHFLSRQLHVPVSLRSLDITKRSADMTKLWIGNPPRSKTSAAFSAETVKIETSLDDLLGDPLLIEEIQIDDIFVGIEFYDPKGADSNWNHILQKETQKPVSHNYLIRTLILRNLTVEVTQVDGKVKRYPRIPQMEFHNISSDTGIPIDEIEKAIFNLMMKNLFQKLPINQLFQNYLPNWFMP